MEVTSVDYIDEGLSVLLQNDSGGADVSSPNSFQEVSSQATETSPFSFFAPIRTSRTFTALWGGQTLSGLGDNILSVILPLVLYTLTNSTLDMGLLMSLLMLPQIVLLPFTGVLVDYWPRIRLMMVADAIRMGLLVGLTVLAANHAMSLKWLYGFAVVYGSMDALFQPAYSAVRAQVFTPSIRNAANSLTQVSAQTSRLIGPSIGGVLVTTASSAIGFAADALTFVLSMVSLLFVRLPAATPTPKKGTSSRQSFLYDLLGGFRELRKHPWLYITISAFAFTNICSAGILTVLIPWLLKVHLHDPGYDYGLLTSAAAVGALVGAVVLGSRRKWHHRGLLAYGGIALQGFTLLGVAYFHGLPILMLLMAMGGAGVMAFGILWEGSLQDLVPTEAFGRVSSIDMLGSFALLPLGYILTGWLAQVMGGIQTMIALALAMIVIVAATMCVPSIRKFD
jgi:MFS family permease